MSSKDKRFPLPLSSVVEKLARTAHPLQASSIKVATSQTAAQNATQNVTRTLQAAKPPDKLIARIMPISDGSARAAPLVSDAVRSAMVVRLAKQGVKDPKVLAAMEAVPRHLFMEPALASQAYIDASLPIGHHQTISQPYIVARMIEVMRANGNDGGLNKVLEIGTGCGYQAAVLSLVAKEVYSIERIKPLHELAKV